MYIKQKTLKKLYGYWVVSFVADLLTVTFTYFFMQITTCIVITELHSKDLKAPPPQIPEYSRVLLSKIANWLLDNGRDEYLTVYGKIRGGVLQRSLNMLKNHQKSVSGGSVHGTTSSPMLVLILVYPFEILYNKFF